MFISMLSVITSVKDYVEIVHKLIESDPTHGLNTYYDLGAIITYVVLTAKQFFIDLISFNWLQTVWALPTLVPNIASSMISEISVLDGYFHNVFTFLETPLSYGDENVFLYCVEKFNIGLINSLFLFLPTSIAHLICFRRFVMQGLEAGYMAGLGTIAGNILWIGSVVFGLRFVVIPWLSLDVLRYLLGFTLLVKYMWDSYTERRVRVLGNLSKQKIFLLNFLLAFTEQTSIYPFVSNSTIGSDSTILESFPVDSFLGFVSVHGSYLAGILLGSLSLLQLTCWFWENPAYNLYIWSLSSFKVVSSAYYKSLNFFFLYMTMLSAISSVTYFGLDYTLSSPLGLVHEDRLIDQKGLLETSFLNTKASDRNTRRNRGRHGRRERWKRRVRKFRTFDASLYGQGTYDLFTIEDLNYGFDRFWLRRKLRNHRVRFRFFPGPWMRSFKKQLARPRLESFMGPRVEFFRILYEQVYHPEFHEFKGRRKTFSNDVSSSWASSTPKGEALNETSSNGLVILSTPRALLDSTTALPTIARVHSKKMTSIYSDKAKKYQTQGLIKEFSALRKFVRKVNSRIKTSNIAMQLKTGQENYTGRESSGRTKMSSLDNSVKPIYSKRWKQIFSRISHSLDFPHLRQQENLLRRFYNQILIKNTKPNTILSNNKKDDALQRLSKKDRQILRYKTFLKQNSSDISKENQVMEYEKDLYKSTTLLHPIKFYLQKEQAFRRKLKFYGVNVFRNFGIENNAAYFRIMMKRFFYYYKPTLRWERTMRTATMRRARRKGPRMPRKRNLNKKTLGLSLFDANDETSLLNPNTSTELTLKNIAPNLFSVQKPTHFYSLVSKRANRYRYQIYKDVLQHWYYTPFNRLLVKFDVDSFIRRQPSAYFLTKKEESLLHLRRFLLSEYYETLRWYTYMQHYGSMKARIGGTKSFANRAYNQQFMGTLKKVRHLFAITPSSTENTILKFDQPLYNEFANDQNYSILNDSVIHEELLADDFIYPNQDGYHTYPDRNITRLQSPKNVAQNDSYLGLDLKNQSALVIRKYLLNAKPIREQFIKKLLSEKNYWELTKFLFKGQKIRGTNAATNERSLILQEKQILYTPEEKEMFEKNQRRKDIMYRMTPYKRFFSEKIMNMPDNNDFGSKNAFFEMNFSGTSFEENLWLALIKRCQNQLYNQESLKVYVSRHIKKRNKQKRKKERSINKRLQRLKNWFISSQSQLSSSTQNQIADRLNADSRSEVSMISKSTAGLTTAFQKAIKEAVFFQRDWSPVKMNIRNNRPQINWAIINSDSDILKNAEKKLSSHTEKTVSTGFNFSGNHHKSTSLKNHLKIRMKLHQMQLDQIENDLRQSIVSIRSNQNESIAVAPQNASDVETQKNETKTSTSRIKSFDRHFKDIFYLLKTTLIPFKRIYKITLNPIINTSIHTINNIFKPNTEGDLVISRKQQTSSIRRRITRRKKIRRRKNRKAFKKLKNKNLTTRDPESRESTLESALNQRNIRNLLQYKTSVADRKNADDSLREKRDVDFQQNTTLTDLENKRHRKSWQQWRKKASASSFHETLSMTENTESQKTSDILDHKKINGKSVLRLFNQILTKKFKRKRSRLRRFRQFRGRGPIKKRTLRDKLKRELKLLKRYKSSAEDSLVLSKTPGLEQGQQKKITTRSDLFELITKKTYEPEDQFQIKETKQKRIRLRKHRFWRKHKRPKYAQNKRKQKKRRRSVVTKIRSLYKELKRIKSIPKIRKWWWENFLPNFQASADAIWQIENDLQIQEQLSKLSSLEILKRDSHATLNTLEKTLQIGDKDYKPLAIPEALRIRENLVRDQSLNFGEKSDLSIDDASQGDLNTLEKLNDSNKHENSAESDNIKKAPLDLIGQISQNSLLSSGVENQRKGTSNSKKYDMNEKDNAQNLVSFVSKDRMTSNDKKVFGMNPIPFYAGWDESLRKFVVTNRLLSNKQAGYTMNLMDSPLNNEIDSTAVAPQNALDIENQRYPEHNEFSRAPLRGMNAGTTLYCQVPFTTYDPDQFFALGMDGFSPIGWRKFHFRRSKQTIKPILVKTNAISSAKLRQEKNQSEFTNELSYNIQMKIHSQIYENRFKQKTSFNDDNQKMQRNIYRRSQKRYKRVRKHPRPPVWFPSGPLMNQVLPVHYIYVFYKRARLPRDRYIRRRLRRNKDGAPLSIRTSLTKLTDMTLRRRSKPRRKYHRKPSQSALRRTSNFGKKAMQYTKTENLLLKRRKFRGFPNEADHFRPIPETQESRTRRLQTGSGASFKSKSKKRRKKQQSESVRIRQLRRRVQRQVIRPVWRYRPRAGGFVWPCDYLRLEKVPGRKLNPNKQMSVTKKDESKPINKRRKNNPVLRKKKSRVIQEWQLQPKKYLLEKHNLFVLKKRLQKSQNSHKIHQRAKELSYLFALR
uniref:Hypothetical chloroplast protein RF1 n=1 Tax=Bracteacoccus minor TaxID=50037 RepID=A0A140HAJ6_9CHLO|nr:hypothetical chloroplast protein RF1 [Bracteacoccus minor]AMO01195.1 hypothetical chloroplast protein RF1 [Bracteacoccus minor]